MAPTTSISSGVCAAVMRRPSDRGPGRRRSTCQHRPYTPPPVSDPLLGCGNLAGGDKQRLVECIHSRLNPPRTVEGAFDVTRRVAWALRGEGAGLLIKPGGENIVTWHGQELFRRAHLLSGRPHLQGAVGRRRPPTARAGRTTALSTAASTCRPSSPGVGGSKGEGRRPSAFYRFALIHRGYPITRS